MANAVILSGARTPVGKLLGALKGFSAVDLGVIAVRAAIERAGIAPVQVDEVIMGNVVQAGNGQNPARQAALRAGIPDKVSALTVNKVCGSGLKAVMLAANGIKVGEIEIAVAGGMESMTNAPYLLKGAREGYRLGNGELIDSMIGDGLWCAFDNWHMGCTGEVVAEQYNVTREEQDEYALNSHRKALAAMKEGRFDQEIVPVEVAQRKGPPLVISADEGPREDTSLEALARLKPAFKEGGTVTAGNAPGVNDGAAALVVTSSEAASRLGRKPLARIVAQAASGARLLVTLLYEMERRDVKRGLAALCLGGGNAVAMAVER